MYQVIERLKSKGNRESTKKTYHRIWTRFNKFLLKLDSKPSAWEDRVALFAAFLVQEGRQSSTIKSYVSAIKYVLQLDGYSWSDNKVLLTTLTRACKLENDVVKTRLPIHVGLLDTLLFELDRALDQQKYLCCMYKALFALSYYGLLRVGELTTGEHPIKAKDIHVAQNKDKILVVLYSSKTHGKQNIPQKVKITGNDKSKKKRHFCPFELTKHYFDMRGGYDYDSEPFFIFGDGTPVTPTHVRTTLRNLLSRLTLDAHLYDTHSFRIGRAGDLLKLNYSISQIRKIGRWRSNVVYKYLRD